MAFNVVIHDATGNPIYEHDMVEYEGKWYEVKKFKKDYILVNDSTKIHVGRIDTNFLFLVEHF